MTYELTHSLMFNHSATGKLTVPAVGSFQSFHQKLVLTCKLESVLFSLWKTCFLNCYYKRLIFVYVI